MREVRELDAIETILNHRSIRKYKPNKKIPRDDLDLILKSAQRALTIASLHLWTAIRITVLKKISEITKAKAI